jgi:zinc-ribbon domain
VQGQADAARRGGTPAARVRWLLVLGGLGLLLSVAGAVLWLRSAWVHLPNAALPWAEASVGAMAVLAGGWALRVAHALWSRIEVESTLTWLEFKGSFFRLPGAAVPQGGDVPAWSRGEPAVGVEDLVLRSCAVQARSVFYADGVQGPGSRVLLTMVANPAAAAVWTVQAKDFARKLAANPAAATPAALAARAKARARRVAESAQPAAARRNARFCPHCGTPVLAGARFCQHCGQTLAPA